MKNGSMHLRQQTPSVAAPPVLAAPDGPHYTATFTLFSCKAFYFCLVLK